MRFLALPSKHSSTIKPSNVLKKDVALWVFAAAGTIALFTVMGLLVTASLPIKASLQTGLGILYHNIILVMALVAASCVAARRRPKDIWTWVLAVLVFFIYIPQNHMNLSIYLLPNGFLQPMVGMIGLLAIGRIIEYFYIRNVIKFYGITMTKGAIIIYGMLGIACYLSNSSIAFGLFTIP